MLSDLQQRKFIVAFKLYDTNGDGVIEKADFLGFAERMARAFDESAPPEAAAQLSQTMANQWEQTRQMADLERDDRITMDEWLKYYEAVTSTPQGINAFADGWTEASFAMYAIVDPNGPQDAQPRERFMKWLTVGGWDAAEAAKVFDRLDADGDGKLSREETCNLVAEWLGDDPSARGNWLMGEI